MSSLKSLTKHLAKSGFGATMRLAPLPLSLAVLSRALSEYRPDGTTTPAKPSFAHNETDITILALSPENFRGDLEALSATPGVRVLTISELWLYRLLYCFYPTSVTPRMYASFFDPAADDPAYPGKQSYRAYLARALPALYRRFGIDCVISFHVHHVPDVDWGAVSQRLGFPYVIFQRECLFASEHVVHYTVERMSKLGRFEGAHVAVHNDVSVKTFEATGFVERERMSILGAIRMDEFTRRLHTGAKAGSRPLATLFAFAVSSVYREEMRPFFADVHLTFVRLARTHPEIDFVIKYKNNVGPTWLRDFEAACAGEGLVPEDLPNLTITGTADPQDLILRSAVVAGFNSTTLLEAGIAGKQVVIPRFGKMAEPDMRVFLYFPDQWDAFDVAESRDAFEAAILDGAVNPRPIPSDVMSRRLAMFEEYVSSLGGDATHKHLMLLKDLSSAGQRTVGRSVWPGRTDAAMTPAQIRPNWKGL